MSKYRKGAVYLRKMKPGDKSKRMMVCVRMAMFSDKSNWKKPEEVNPVVMMRYGKRDVFQVFMNQGDALKSLITGVQRRRRNPKHNPKRGLYLTKGDLRKAFSKWADKNKGEKNV